MIILLFFLVFSGYPLKGQDDPKISKIRSFAEKSNIHLINSIREFRNEILSKIDSDIDITASAFADAKNIQRSLKWADIFGLGLDIVTSTIDTVSILLNFSNPSKALSEEFIKFTTPLEALSFFLTIESLKESGNNLSLTIDGPSYTSNIKKMLDHAYNESSTRLFFNYEAYRLAIKNRILGIQGSSPLIIVRKSSDKLRRNVKTLFGTLNMEKTIRSDYRKLEEIINNNPIPYDLEIEIANQIDRIRKSILKSKLNRVEIKYNTYLNSKSNVGIDELVIKLGSIAELERARLVALDYFDKKIEIRETMTLTKAAGGMLKAGTIYLTMNYDSSGLSQDLIQVSKILIVPKGINFTDNMMKSISYRSDPRSQINMKPQEMLISLSKELSDLWMISDDLMNYINYEIQKPRK